MSAARRRRRQRQVRRREVLDQAAPIWQATERAEVQRRKEAFCATWREREPKVVSRLERVFPATLGYLTVLERARERGEVWLPQCLRATSWLERANRHLRQKARQVGVFHSTAGLEAGFALVVVHRGLGPWRYDPDCWAEELEVLLAR